MEQTQNDVEASVNASNEVSRGTLPPVHGRTLAGATRPHTSCPKRGREPIGKRERVDEVVSGWQGNRKNTRHFCAKQNSMKGQVWSGMKQYV